MIPHTSLDDISKHNINAPTFYCIAFLIGVGISLFSWVSEALLHTYIFQDGPYLSQLIPSNKHELWMRSFSTGLVFIITLFSACFIRNILQKKRDLRLASLALNTMLESCIITDENNTIIYTNLQYTNLTGYSAHEVLGKNPNVLSSGKQDKKFYQNLWSELIKNGAWEGEIWNRKKSGELFPEWIKLKVIQDGDGKPCYYIGVFSDVTSRKKIEAKLLHYAFYDPLTSLPNRRLFTERLDQAIRVSKRNKDKMAVIFLDLDYFKEVNDQHGHIVGDKLLCHVANTIKTSLREVDTLARFGGDEFVILLPNLRSKKDVTQLIKRLLSGFKNFRFITESQEISITASMGGALYPDDTIDAEALIKHADTAMYHVKKNGRNNFYFYKKGM
jgi:diguanylate cyclase (GGDEF)-like protein/PAS domain S-box-containing protein